VEDAVRIWLAVLALLIAATTAACDPEPVRISREDLDHLAVTTYTDVTNLGATGGASFTITRQQAINLARDHISAQPIGLRILTARAPLVVGEADHDVWIIVFPAEWLLPRGSGEASPASAAPTTLVAVMVDANTGAIVRSYSR
jgi:hypothetical protein